MASDMTGSTPRGRSEKNTRDHPDSDASALGDEVKAQAGELAGNLKDQARHFGDQVSDVARDRVRSSFERQQGVVAEQIAGVADALRDAADQLSERDQGMGARYVRGAADRVERFADQVRARDFDDLITQTETFARRQPELFIGGALLAGVALGRFLRASGNRRRVARDVRTGRTTRGTGDSDRYGGSGTAAYGSSGYAGARNRPYTADYGDDLGRGPSGGLDEFGNPQRTRSSRADDFSHYPAADALAGRNRPEPMAGTTAAGLAGGGGMGYAAATRSTGGTASMGTGAGGQGSPLGGTGAGGLGDTGSRSSAGTPGSTGVGMGAGKAGAMGGAGLADSPTGATTTTGATAGSPVTAGSPPDSGNRTPSESAIGTHGAGTTGNTVKGGTSGGGAASADKPASTSNRPTEGAKP